MKNMLSILLFSLCSVTLLAQDNIVIHASKRNTIEKTPRQIIDSLNKRFPNAKSIQSFTTSNKSVAEGWNVGEENTLSDGEDIDYYTLSFKRADFQYYALFQADGTMLKAKYQQYGRSLPDAVKSSLKKLAGSTYKDYYIQSDTYYKTVDSKSSRSYYEITAKSRTNSNVKRLLTVNENGTVTKVR